MASRTQVLIAMLAGTLGISAACHATPDGAVEVSSLTAARGEIVSTSIALRSEQATDAVLTYGDLTCGQQRIGREDVDVKVIVSWYQSSTATYDVHRSPAAGRVRLPSLLVHDEKLFRIDDRAQRNFVRIDRDGVQSYVDISAPDSSPGDRKMSADRVPITDSDHLEPFHLDAGKTKLLWLTISVPMDLQAATCSTMLTLSNHATNRQIAAKKFELTVLPFSLSESPIEYSLYYRGILSPLGSRYLTSEEKTPAQMLRELRNMHRFGVTNPTVYQPFDDPKGLEQVLQLREQAGISNKVIYYLGLTTAGYDNPGLWARNLVQLHDMKPMLTRHGVTDFYLYGIDEAGAPDVIRNQYALWHTLQQAGFKIFTATYRRELVDAHIGHVDMLNCQLTLTPEEIATFKAKGTRIYAYGQPQVGVQNAALFRENYGLRAWRTGYDGVMDYAYQHEAGNIWNDFDDATLRDHVFAYPTVDGLIDTLPWYGFREATTDVRYIQTLIDRIAQLSSKSLPAMQSPLGSGRDLLERVQLDPTMTPDLARAQIARYLVETEALVGP